MVRLLEYQGKSLLKSRNIPVPKGEVGSTSLETKQIAEKLGKPVAIKAQVTATGRFKAGGVGFANTLIWSRRVWQHAIEEVRFCD